VCAETEGSIIVMPKNAKTGHTAYICECGKKCHSKRRSVKGSDLGMQMWPPYRC
jgi:hypothetical protein